MMDLALIVPFHNEARCLPSLIRALRAQSRRDVPIVFVDNASTDASPGLVQQTEEVRTGQWTCLREERIGKGFAIRTGTTHCLREFDARHIGFLDADSYPAQDDWVANSVDQIADASGRLGFTYSPLHYVGFQALPIFADAYRAYEAVQHDIMRSIGWLANGQAFVCATETMAEYFSSAEITTEFDLRLALLALREGREARLNPSLIVTSGRRMVVNAGNFAAWCFYEREYYSKKDINARQKLNLDRPQPVADIPRTMVGRFFARRALKLAGRHVLPLAICDPTGIYFARMRAMLGLDLEESFAPLAARLDRDPSWLLTDDFDEMIGGIEAHPATRLVAARIASLMARDYGASIAAPIELEVS
jgi:hypothetical protein